MQAIFDNFGIYMHVPFCAKNCGYCRFYKHPPTLENIGAYARAIARELSAHESENGGELSRPQTMFWGGGTPSILSEADIESIVFAMSNVLPTREWTVEVAPSSASKGKLKLLKDFGVTRVSMGVQSFDKKTLDALGRAHKPEAALKTIDDIAETGFKHFSIDLIFGAPNQTEDEWLADIERAAACPVDHISAYCLEFESGTSCCAGKLTDEEYEKRAAEAEFFEIAMRRLPELGFAQYEISNYAKAGAECLHNLSTWNMAQWLGFGPAAASQWRGTRRRNAPDFSKWLAGLNSGNPVYDDVVELDDSELFSSALIFGLRMNAGVDLAEIAARFPKADARKYADTLQFLEAQGLLQKCGSRVKLTRDGRCVADAIAVELL